MKYFRSLKLEVIKNNIIETLHLMQLARNELSTDQLAAWALKLKWELQPRNEQRWHVGLEIEIAEALEANLKMFLLYTSFKWFEKRFAKEEGVNGFVGKNCI